MGKSGGGGARRPSVRVRERTGHNVAITLRGDVAGAARNLFGRAVSPATLAKLAGAQPDSRIKIMASADKLFIGFDLHDQAARYYATRSVSFSPKDGALMLHNHMLEVAQPGGGVGARLFGTQVKTAARLGVTRIETTGAREDTRTPHPVIGYKVWPAMGYNAPVPDSFRARLPASLQGVRTMLDLYQHPQGRALWSQYGKPIDLTFDLSRGSRSMTTLQSYLRHKGIAWKSL